MLLASLATVASVALLAPSAPGTAFMSPASDHVVVALSTATVESEALQTFYSQSLTWSRCAGSTECAWLDVPRDYAAPQAGTIRLRLSRVKATGSADDHQGSIVANPGGPGAPGLTMATYLASQVSPSVAAAFDFVGFDPRGVDESAPVTCMTGKQTTRWLSRSQAPLTASQQRRFMSAAESFPRGCLRMSPEIARHIGSDNAVRDLDILRAALGDARLNWFGYSYGTYLGALYAQAFPDRVGRFVLDGAVDPALDAMELSEGQSDGFQVALTRFAADCARRASCPYRGSASGVIRGINVLLTSLRSRTIPGTYGPLRQSDAITAIFYSLYSPQSWPWLRRALAQAERGNGVGLASIADASSNRTGRYAYAGNMASAFPAISCWDSPAPPGLPGLRSAAEAWAARSPAPDLARSMAWSNAPCSHWFGHSERGARPVRSTTTAPILIIGTTYDPATPYAWAQSLASQLPTSTLLTYVGDGHTAYGTGSACVDKAVDHYLLSDVPPPTGTRCR